MFDHHTYVGFAGYGTDNDLKNTELQMGYGGLVAGYIFKPEKIIHYNMEMLVGAGGFSRNNTDKNDVFAVIEPAVNVGISLTENVDLSLGLSYRFLKETGQNNISDSDFSGWSANTNLIFGYF